MSLIECFHIYANVLGQKKALYSIQLLEACYCKYCSLIFYDFIELVFSFLFV